MLIASRHLAALSLLSCCSVLVLATPISAGPIGSGDFSGSEHVDDFTDVGSQEGIALGGAIIGQPLERTYGAYIGGADVIKWDDFGALHTFGPALATFASGNDYIEVEFDIPATRAGGWIGLQDALVEFFDPAGNELGQVFVDYQIEPVFAGWEDTSVGIKRVRFTDVGGSGIMSIDRVTVEPVEPMDPPPGPVPALPTSALWTLSALICGTALWQSSRFRATRRG